MALPVHPPPKKATGQWYEVTLELNRTLAIVLSLRHNVSIWLCINANRKFPDIVAQDLVFAGSPYEATEKLLIAFWENQIATSTPGFTSGQITARARAFHVSLHNQVPPELTVHATVRTDEATRDSWNYLCRKVPVLGHLVATLKRPLSP